MPLMEGLEVRLKCQLPFRYDSPDDLPSLSSLAVLVTSSTAMLSRYSPSMFPDRLALDMEDFQGIARACLQSSAANSCSTWIGHLSVFVDLLRPLRVGLQRVLCVVYRKEKRLSYLSRIACGFGQLRDGRLCLQRGRHQR